MGTSASERVVVAVETTSNLGGVRATRAEMGALTKEAKTATAELAQAATAGTAAETTLAGAAQKATVEQAKLTATTEQGRIAWQRAGGDMSRFAQELQKLILEEEALAKATRDAAAAATEQAKVPPPGAGGPAGGANVPALLTPAADKQLTDLPAKARSGANALAILAQSAQMGSGSLAGLAVASSNVATSIASVSRNAKLAAAATGVGALVTVVVTLVGLLSRAHDELDSLGGATTNFAALNVQQLKLQETATRAQFASLTEQLANTSRFSVSQAETLTKLQADTANRLVGIHAARLQAERDAEREAGENRKRDLEKVAEERRRDLERAHGLNAQLTEAGLSALDAANLAQDQAAIRRIERERDRTLAEIEQLKISEEEKRVVRAAAEDAASSEIYRIRKATREKDAEEAAKLAEEEEKRRNQALAQLADSILQTAQSSIQAGESLSKVLTKTALAPIVTELQALAKRELVKAGLHALAGDLIGAGKHAAAAGLAIAGSREVAQMAGLSGGGGSGGAPAGSGGGRGSLLGEVGRGGEGNVNVVIQMVDPRSSAVLEETSWQLQRGGILKRPIYAPSSSAVSYPQVRSA